MNYTYKIIYIDNKQMQSAQKEKKEKDSKKNQKPKYLNQLSESLSKEDSCPRGPWFLEGS